MNRKSTLLEISKEYEKILEEMNVGIPSQAQNAIPMDEDENVLIRHATDPTRVSFSIPKSPEEMAATANAGDEMHNSCPQCETGECEQSEEEEECDVNNDSNLNMLKSEVFKIVKDSKELMSILGKDPEIDTWMLGKIIKASDYVSSVKDYLDYKSFKNEVEQCIDDISNSMDLVSQITNMLNGEGKFVNEQVLKRIKFNLEILKENE
jgi:uncharacterized Zn finger protein (UPF0148 family)